MSITITNCLQCPEWMSCTNRQECRRTNTVMQTIGCYKLSGTASTPILLIEKRFQNARMNGLQCLSCFDVLACAQYYGQCLECIGGL